jgi:hypothetical protein
MPSIFQCVNNALSGCWADLACHETGCKSFVSMHGALKSIILSTALVVHVQHENVDTRDLVDEVLQSFDRLVRDAWGSKSRYYT